MSKRAILYARVSTDDQADKGYSLPTQADACQKLAARLALEVSPALTFSDDCSGATLDRPALTQLRHVAHAGDTLIVYAFDRLSRDPIDLLVISRELEQAQLKITSVTEGDLPDGEMGGLLRYIKGREGEKEREKIMERSIRGRRAKAASGKWVGTSYPPYGYRRVGERQHCRLEIDEAEAAVIRDIFQRFIDGQPIMAIAREFDAARVPPPSRSRAGTHWYETTLKRIIRNQVYLGTLQQYGQTQHNPSLAIVHPGTWEAARARLALNRRQAPAGRQRDYLLTGFIECACGHRMHGCHIKPDQPKSYLYYICSIVSHRDPGCHESVLPLAKADAITWDWIMGILCDDERREKGLREYADQRAHEVQPIQSEAASIGELLAKVERKVSRYAAALGDEDDEIKTEALNQQLSLAAQELARLRERQAKLAGLIEQHEVSQGKIDEIRRMTAAIRRRLPGDPSTAQKRDLLDVLNVSVKLRRDEAGRRWLDLSCGIPDWAETVPADNHSSAIPTG
jgi:site-specific DNA recombinase